MKRKQTVWGDLNYIFFYIFSLEAQKKDSWMGSKKKLWASKFKKKILF